MCIRDRDKLAPDIGRVEKTGQEHGDHNTERCDRKMCIRDRIKGMPLEEAGLEAGDVITKINGVEVPDGNAYEKYIEEHPLSKKPVTDVYKRQGCSLPGNGMGKNFCPGNFFWCKTLCTDPNCIFCIRLLLHRFHAVFQWRSCQLQHGRFSGGIRTDFFDHIIRDSCVRDPHCSIFHRTVTGTVQHLSLIHIYL